MQIVSDLSFEGEITPGPGEARELKEWELEEIYPDIKKKKKRAEIEQGMNLGNCYFALGIAALREMPIFDKLARECVKKIKDGWRVTFWGSNKSFDVYKNDLGVRHEIDNGREKIMVGQIITKNKIDQIIEVAYGRYLKSKGDAAAHTYAHHNKGGFSHHVLEVLLGPYYDRSADLDVFVADDGQNPESAGMTMNYSKEINTFFEAGEEAHKKVLKFLRLKKDASEQVILTAATPYAGIFDRQGARHERAKKGQDEMGKNLKYMDAKRKIAARHAYGVNVLRAVSDDQLDPNHLDQAALVEIINPWDTNKRVTLNFKEFLEYFRLLKPVRILEPRQQEEEKIMADLEPINNQFRERVYPLVKFPGMQMLEVKKGYSRTMDKSEGPFNIGKFDTFFKVWKENGQWFVKRLPPQIEETRIVGPAAYGKNLLFGRANDAYMRDTDSRFSREHFYLSFSKNDLTVVGESKNGTNVYYSQNPEPLDMKEEVLLYNKHGLDSLFYEFGLYLSPIRKGKILIGLAKEKSFVKEEINKFLEAKMLNFNLVLTKEVKEIIYGSVKGTVLFGLDDKKLLAEYLFNQYIGGAL